VRREDDRWTRIDAEPLQRELHGDAAAMCTTRYVQDAPTVEEMIRRSGVPRELWYAPKTVVKPPTPVVDADAAQAIARRCVEVRSARGLGRGPFAALICVAPGALWRIENGRIKHDEVDGVESALAKLETEDRG